MCIPVKLDSVKETFVQSFKNNFQDRFENLGIDWDAYYISIFQGYNNESPMTTNRASKIVFYDPQKAIDLGLSNDELVALFAHEIGHILDSTGADVNGDCTPSPEREYNADKFAIGLGLRDCLLSGLRKINKVTPVTPHDRLQIIESQS